jgi:small GTP-binding protein
MEQGALKAIILGEANVGKTSILSQWVSGTFTEDTAPTIATGLTPVQLMIDGAVHPFHIWDTAGTPQFRSVVPMYCRQAALAIIVFDITQRSSFETVKGWHSFVREHADPKFLLVGNKLDLDDVRQVQKEEAEEITQTLGCQYVEMSAKTKLGLETFARAVIDSVRDVVQLAVTQPHYSAVLAPEPASECGC